MSTAKSSRQRPEAGSAQKPAAPRSSQQEADSCPARSLLSEGL